MDETLYDLTDEPSSTPSVNAGYALFQISRAFVTSTEHSDPSARERAQKKITQWESVYRNILSGSIQYGSRTPVQDAPAWATLEVVTGGFATGTLLAGGPLQPHEKKTLENLSQPIAGQERLALNVFFLTDAGLIQLRDQLASGCYDINVPEEGALLVVAWLVGNGFSDEARALLEIVSPYFEKLRFYPIPLEKPTQFGSRIHLQDVRKTIVDLQKIIPSERILAQKEAIGIWAPFYDRLIALFLETVEEDWPCQVYPHGWRERAVELQREYEDLRKSHRLCSKPDRARRSFTQLRSFLARCTENPALLTGREVGRIRSILHCYVEKRGHPESAQCKTFRQIQRQTLASPTFDEFAKVVLERLGDLPGQQGVDDVSPLNAPLTREEGILYGIPIGTAIPISIRKKVERCLNETVQVLVEPGLITSGETLARVLPQMTSGLQTAGIENPALRHLDAAIYRAFRRRRSLLLLNLKKQIQIEELPWVSAINRFRISKLSESVSALQALEEIVVITLTAFPYAILPNKLLQELKAVAAVAKLEIPLVEEVAADIFMGVFSNKFLDSAKIAAKVCSNTLYEKYYGIDFVEIQSLSEEPAKDSLLGRIVGSRSTSFIEVCVLRSGVPSVGLDPASNGMVIEQQQILTTQNLAVFFERLDLKSKLNDRLIPMAEQCFGWICRRHQMKVDLWHDRQIVLKNSAYAWRQMIFYLSLCKPYQVNGFLQWAEQHLKAQTSSFISNFRPVLLGLEEAASGRSLLKNDQVATAKSRCYLGWSKNHWFHAAKEH